MAVKMEKETFLAPTYDSSGLLNYDICCRDRICPAT